ncbi:WD repeat-containing protein 54 [Mytilus coruscus]|uniref:WD repeat-containing protein 54 n=1 Tax=Mytilus coruscus TaxID=42192 RepID=A0A6J8EPN4_MYTCO|nr:WD repeat-containing protein 54 [Mytilus coruscus]
MYRKEKPLPLKSSASSLTNNLTVFISPEKGSMSYAVVHKSVVNVISSSLDGSTVTNRQVVCKEPSAVQQNTPMVIQAKWISLPTRTVLVLTSLRGIQMFESDGSAMIYWHALGDPSSSDTQDQTNYGRGIAGVGDSFICVGTQIGEIHVFNVPAKGTNIMLKESLVGHKHPICDLTSGPNKLISSDEQGNIFIWSLQPNGSLKQTGSVMGKGVPCSSLVLWNDIIVGGYGDGQLRVYCAKTAKLAATVNAHARWVNAIDVAPETGRILSVSEDTFAKVWQLKEGNLPEIEYKYSESVTDLQLVGGQFIQKGGRGFCVTGYDNSDITFFVQN